MKEEIKVPSMGESISEATVSAILKPAGSFVKAEDELFELETDKVNQVLYAQKAGIFNPSVKVEEVVKIGQSLGFIEEKSGDEPPAKEPDAPKKEVEAPKKEEKQATIATNEGSVRLSVEEVLSELKEPVVKNEPIREVREKVVSDQPETRKKLTKIRKLIATRLVEVQSTTAMLTTFNEVDLTEIMTLREKYKESFTKVYGAKLGLMSFFVKSAVSALKAYPEVNSYIDGDELVERHNYAIGIAVGGEKGLVVPVLKNCDQLSFGEIEQTIAGYAQKVKDGTLSVDDLFGGGFTITNGGVYGSLLSTPILNPKQCAILGMHKILKRPVVIDDQIVIRQMMYLALSYDHRIIDGKEAVSFLVHIKNCLEDPRRLLLEV